MLSYQHAFHAGNRADVLKHAVLLAILKDIRKQKGPIFYVETHSGRGRYDLTSKEARKLREHDGGIVPIATGKAPKPLRDYVTDVRKENTEKHLNTYPGSPAFAASVLAPTDRMALFELHPAEHTFLADVFKADDRVQVRKTDGYAGALKLAPRSRERMVVFVDPSYETVGDLEQIVDWTPRALRRWPQATIVIWLPLFKDERELEFGAYLSELESGVIAGARWPSHLDERSSLEGSAIIAYRVSEDAAQQATAIATACEQFWRSAS